MCSRGTLKIPTPIQYVCMYACMHVCALCTYVSVCVYVCMYVCMYICMYVCTQGFQLNNEPPTSKGTFRDPKFPSLGLVYFAGDYIMGMRVPRLFSERPRQNGTKSSKRSCNT